MNWKLARRVHLYLGCFFAPLLVFYVATGWYQTFNTNRNKSLAEADSWVEKLASVHKDRVYPSAKATSYSTKFFEALVVVMSVAVLLTVGLGIALALKAGASRWPVLAALILGVVMPILALWMGQRVE
ncbi:MAG: hypothetical protein FJ404_12030 [Verrucomicrobia bacterium]|nr:hypothetical protein [Verrucomicrobiota bacterium]